MQVSNSLISVEVHSASALICIIGIKHVFFLRINICWDQREALKHNPERHYENLPMQYTEAKIENFIGKKLLLSHLLIAGCDIGVQISVRTFVRSSVRSSVRSFVRPSTFTSKFSFLDIRDSCESETLHSNCP